MTDPEITTMLSRLHATDRRHDAAAALQRFHAEALAGARDGADKVAKEQLVSAARERLRENLRELLNWA